MLQSIEEKKQILSKYDYPYEEFKKLEQIRGIPIELRDYERQDVEYEEYCSQELLDKKPYVSVWMITYNHEKYISRAIEGVVMQQCDFPIELIIVEDHSSDRTLEICKQWQRDYPHIIRLFTPVKREPFALAQMLKTPQRINSILRGKYLAYCEGDDWWTDMKKLQMEVNVLEEKPEIGLCFTSFMWREENNNGFIHEKERNIHEHIGNFYEEFLLNDKWPLIQTAGMLMRTKDYISFVKNNVLAKIILSVGDLKLFFALTEPNGEYYVLPQSTYIYNHHLGGASSGNHLFKVLRDINIIRYYYTKKITSTDDFDSFIHFYFSALIERIKLSTMDDNLLIPELENIFMQASKKCFQKQRAFICLYKIHDMYFRYKHISKIILRLMSKYKIPLYKNPCLKNTIARILPYSTVLTYDLRMKQLNCFFDTKKHKLRMILPEFIVKYGSKLIRRKYTPKSVIIKIYNNI